MNEISKVQLMRSTTDDFIRRGDEMHREQRLRILALEEEYTKRRATIAAEYARRTSELAYEGVEALRRLDEQHKGELAAERGKLEAIGRLRG